MKGKFLQSLQIWDENIFGQKFGARKTSCLKKSFDKKILFLFKKLHLKWTEKIAMEQLIFLNCH
jgi:hypothetical protein